MRCMGMIRRRAGVRDAHGHWSKEQDVAPQSLQGHMLMCTYSKMSLKQHEFTTCQAAGSHLQHLERAGHSLLIDQRALHMEHGRLRHGCQHLVGRLDGQVCALLHGAAGQRGMQAKVGPMCLVHDEGHPGCVADLGELCGVMGQQVAREQSVRASAPSRDVSTVGRCVHGVQYALCQRHTIHKVRPWPVTGGGGQGETHQPDMRARKHPQSRIIQDASHLRSSGLLQSRWATPAARLPPACLQPWQRLGQQPGLLG